MVDRLGGGGSRPVVETALLRHDRVRMRFALHLTLHAAVPLAIAWGFYRRDFRRAFLVLVGTMVVDLDHLLATPIIDPGRCSIGFHPLHSYPAIALWCAAAMFRPTRLVGIGLLIHMALDFLDCLAMRAC